MNDFNLLMLFEVINVCQELKMFILTSMLSIGYFYLCIHYTTQFLNQTRHLKILMKGIENRGFKIIYYIEQKLTELAGKTSNEKAVISGVHHQGSSSVTIRGAAGANLESAKIITVKSILAI